MSPPTDRPSQAERSSLRREVAQWMQLAVVGLGVGGIFFAVGQRDRDIENIKSATSDLLRIQSGHTLDIALLREKVAGIERTLERRQ